MCFYNDDYDWTAGIHEETGLVADKQYSCFECGDVIEPGEWLLHIYQQEHGECQVCEWEDGEHPGEPCDYGESYEYRCCHDCAKLRAVIYAVEEDEGCPEHTREPSYGEMWGEAFNYQDEEDVGKYLAKAATMYPGWRHSYFDLHAEMV